MKTKPAPKNSADLAVAIRDMADRKDWRYFEFYLGYVQYRSPRMSTGEMLRHRQAREVAATECADRAPGIKATYMDIIVPTLEPREDYDAKQALYYTHEALVLCPEA